MNYNKLTMTDLEKYILEHGPVVPDGQEITDISVDPYKSNKDATVLTIKTGPGRGGHREGSGRKRLGKVVMSIRVKPETRDKIKSISEEVGCQMGAVVDFVLEDYENRLKR